MNPCRQSDGFGDDKDEVLQTTAYGPRAISFELEDEDELSDSDEEDTDLVNKSTGAGGWTTLWGYTRASDSEDVSDTDSEGSIAASDFSGDKTNRIQNFDLDDDAKYHTFNEEVFESLQRGAKEGVIADNLVLEINSSRHAYAVSSTQVIQSLVSSLLLIAAANTESPEKQAAKLLAQVKHTLSQFHVLLVKYVKTEAAQNDCLEGLAIICKDNQMFLPIAAKVLEALYDGDILSEKSIVMWFTALSTTSAIRYKVKAFIDWLQEADDESSEEDSD